tara:strand:- start:463 stop:648 length:186 start_codon:yes stop_codon:yes gene_type:complete
MDKIHALDLPLSLILLLPKVVDMVVVMVLLLVVLVVLVVGDIISTLGGVLVNQVQTLVKLG